MARSTDCDSCVGDPSRGDRPPADSSPSVGRPTGSSQVRALSPLNRVGNRVGAVLRSLRTACAQCVVVISSSHSSSAPRGCRRCCAPANSCRMHLAQRLPPKMQQPTDFQWDLIFHTMVSRPQPACRTGMPCCNSLSSALAVVSSGSRAARGRNSADAAPSDCRVPPFLRQQHAADAPALRRTPACRRSELLWTVLTCSSRMVDWGRQWRAP